MGRLSNILNGVLNHMCTDWCMINCTFPSNSCLNHAIGQTGCVIYTATFAISGVPWEGIVVSTFVLESPSTDSTASTVMWQSIQERLCIALSLFIMGLGGQCFWSCSATLLAIFSFIEIQCTVICIHYVNSYHQTVCFLEYLLKPLSSILPWSEKFYSSGMSIVASIYFTIFYNLKCQWHGSLVLSENIKQTLTYYESLQTSLVSEEFHNFLDKSCTKLVDNKYWI